MFETAFQTVGQASFYYREVNGEVLKWYWWSAPAKAWKEVSPVQLPYLARSLESGYQTRLLEEQTEREASQKTIT